MNSYEWEWLLNKDDTLCFFPVGHSVEGNYKIHFELSGSCNLRVSDAEWHGKPVLLFEYFDEDDDRWICPYISRHLLSLNPLQARCRRYSRGER